MKSETGGDIEEAHHSGVSDHEKGERRRTLSESRDEPSSKRTKTELIKELEREVETVRKLKKLQDKRKEDKEKNTKKCEGKDENPEEKEKEEDEEEIGKNDPRKGSKSLGGKKEREK